MSRELLASAADPGVQKSVAAVSAVTGAGTIWATLRDIALELFGVPLPVVLACATAAFGALSLRSSTSYGGTLWAGTVWTAIGTWGAQFALSLIGGWMGVAIPHAAIAGGGMALAGFGAMFATRANAAKAQAAMGRWLDGLGGRS